MNELSILKLIGRNQLFNEDIISAEKELVEIILHSRFLILGGAGSIGKEVVKEIFKRNPRKLHVLDINENNLVELVRDIRASYGYISGEFKTFALDICSIQYDAFIQSDGKYDYVLNLSALKHVRSEKDPYTLMRMIDVNILNTEKTLKQSIANGAEKYFCVSTDKATNPINMMGASKRIMEMFLMRRSSEIKVSSARFANVAFSDGSLLYGFNHRIQKKQAIVVPDDVKRYFVTPKESGELCILSCIFGDNRDIFFPKLDEKKDLIPLSEMAKRFIELNGYEPFICYTEEEARELARVLPNQGKWPCLFTKSDTTGEKNIEEFFSVFDNLDLSSFKNIGIIKNLTIFDEEMLNYFLKSIDDLKNIKKWSKKEILTLFKLLIKDFTHVDTGKYLDGKM